MEGEEAGGGREVAGGCREEGGGLLTVRTREREVIE